MPGGSESNEDTGRENKTEDLTKKSPSASPTKNPSTPVAACQSVIRNGDDHTTEQNGREDRSTSRRRSSSKKSSHRSSSRHSSTHSSHSSRSRTTRLDVSVEKDATRESRDPHSSSRSHRSESHRSDRHTSRDSYHNVKRNKDKEAKRDSHRATCHAKKHVKSDKHDTSHDKEEDAKTNKRDTSNEKEGDSKISKHDTSDDKERDAIGNEDELSDDKERDAITIKQETSDDSGRDTEANKHDTGDEKEKDAKANKHDTSEDKEKDAKTHKHDTSDHEERDSKNKKHDTSDDRYAETNKHDTTDEKEIDAKTYTHDTNRDNGKDEKSDKRDTSSEKEKDSKSSKHGSSRDKEKDTKSDKKGTSCDKQRDVKTDTHDKEKDENTEEHTGTSCEKIKDEISDKQGTSRDKEGNFETATHDASCDKEKDANIEKHTETSKIKDEKSGKQGTSRDKERKTKTDTHDASRDKEKETKSSRHGTSRDKEKDTRTEKYNETSREKVKDEKSDKQGTSRDKERKAKTDTHDTSRDKDAKTDKHTETSRDKGKRDKHSTSRNKDRDVKSGKHGSSRDRQKDAKSGRHGRSRDKEKDSKSGWHSDSSRTTHSSSRQRNSTRIRNTKVQCNLPLEKNMFFRGLLHYRRTSHPKFGAIIYEQEDASGRGVSLHAYQEQIDLLPQEELKDFAKEFFAMAFKEDANGAAMYTIAVVHGSASYLPELLGYLNDTYPHLYVTENGLMTQKESKMRLIGEYYDEVKANYREGTFKMGPMDTVNCTGGIKDGVGTYMGALIKKLEDNAFLNLAMPWGPLSILENTAPQDSDDGPILWSRPGEQMVSFGISDHYESFEIKRCSITELYSNSTRRRLRDFREMKFEDRTNPHADHVNSFTSRRTTAAVGVLKSVQFNDPRASKRVSKDVICFDAKDFIPVANFMSLDMHAEAQEQCSRWINKAALNSMRKLGYRYSTLELNGDDIYFIPRNVIHQFRTVTATTSIAWHLRLKAYHASDDANKASTPTKRTRSVDSTSSGSPERSKSQRKSKRASKVKSRKKRKSSKPSTSSPTNSHPKDVEQSHKNDEKPCNEPAIVSNVKSEVMETDETKPSPAVTVPPSSPVTPTEKDVSHVAILNHQRTLQDITEEQFEELVSQKKVCPGDMTVQSLTTTTQPPELTKEVSAPARTFKFLAKESSKRPREEENSCKKEPSGSGESVDETAGPSGFRPKLLKKFSDRRLTLGGPNKLPYDRTDAEKREKPKRQWLTRATDKEPLCSPPVSPDVASSDLPKTSPHEQSQSLLE